MIKPPAGFVWIEKNTPTDRAQHLRAPTCPDQRRFRRATRAERIAASRFLPPVHQLPPVAEPAPVPPASLKSEPLFPELVE